MKKIPVLFIISVFVFNSLNAQNQRFYPDINSDEIKCIKVNYFRVSKDSIQNYPLFFSEGNDDQQLSFIETIIYAIEYYGLTAYSARSFDCSNEFYTIMTTEEVYTELGSFIGNKIIETANGFDTIEVQHKYDISEINSFIFKEYSLFDYSDNLIDKRLVGICPIRVHNFDEESYYKKTFWIYFPEAFSLLEKNDAISKDGDNLGSFLDFIINENYNAVNLSSPKAWNTSDPVKIQEYTQLFENFYANQNSESLSDLPSVILNDDDILPLQYSNPNETIVAAKSVYRRVWNDSINNEMFLPKTTLFGYKSLIDVILNGIFTQGLTAYKARANDIGNEYDVIITEEEVFKQMGAFTETVIIELNDGEYDTVNIQTPYNSASITSYLIHEVELYNANGDVVQTQTIGICPVREFFRQDDPEHFYPLFKKTFWIYYSDFQRVASRNYITQLSCDAPITYDEYLFNQNYIGYNVTDSLALRHSSYDKKYFEEEFGHLYINLYSEGYIIGGLTKNINFVDNSNIDIDKKRKFKKAKIVHTKISVSNDTALFLPIYPNRGFMSLLDVIINAISVKGKRAYLNDDFTSQLSTSDVLNVLGEETYLSYFEDNDGNPDSMYITNPYNVTEIQQFELKELWLYDRRDSVVAKQILAINPIRTIYKDDDWDQNNPFYYRTFWIDFNEFTSIFSQNYVTQYVFTEPITFAAFFANQKYTFEISNETEITKKEAKIILKSLN